MRNSNRMPYVNGMGTTTLAHDLRCAADAQDSEAVMELGGVDAERLRLVADKLESNECEIEALTEHAKRVHRALCEAIEDLDAREPNPAVVFVLVPATAPFVSVDALTPREFSALATFLLDEVE